VHLLERHFRDMQDIEFTIERGRLWFLQCRSGKRTGFAAVKIAVDLVKEKLITKEEALMRVEPTALDQLLQPVFVPAELAAARKDGRFLTKGFERRPGRGVGTHLLLAHRSRRAEKPRRKRRARAPSRLRPTTSWAWKPPRAF
jgi:pyruvate,orthophosphate dikinase